MTRTPGKKEPVLSHDHHHDHDHDHHHPEPGAADDFSMDELTDNLSKIVTEVQELADGWALRFENDPSVYFAAASMVPLFSLMGISASYRMEIDLPGQGSIWLHAFGDKEAMGNLLAEWALIT